MSADIRQVETVTRSARGIMASKAFGEGFRDARAGREFRYEYSTHTDTQWAYERGRLFGCYYGGALKINRAISRSAMIAMNDAVRTGAIL